MCSKSRDSLAIKLDLCFQMKIKPLYMHSFTSMMGVTHWIIACVRATAGRATGTSGGRELAGDPKA